MVLDQLKEPGQDLLLLDFFSCRYVGMKKKIQKKAKKDLHKGKKRKKIDSVRKKDQDGGAQWLSYQLKRLDKQTLTR